MQEQRGFCPGCSTVNTHLQMIEGAYMCFVNLEKVYDWVLQGILWEVPWEYSVPGPCTLVLCSVLSQTCAVWAWDFAKAAHYLYSCS